MVTNEKEKYLSNLGNKLSDPQTGPKKYWNILKKILKKIQHPIFHQFFTIINFLLKPRKNVIFSMSFFQKTVCSPPTPSVLPSLNKSTLFSIKDVEFTKDDITKHIRKLNPNKPNGHDNIPIRILKIFDHSISLPLFIIYGNCIKNNYFPDEWKKGNIIPVFKKMKEIQ